MSEKTTNKNRLVMTEEEALEFFAFLISAARTQLDDPASYASMRLLDAAERLRESISERASLPSRDFLASTEELSTRAMIYMDDRKAYTADLDELNRRAARFLKEQIQEEGAGND
jgi:hypothetical protein